MSKWYAYVILCDDGSLYKGHTDNLERRYHQHETGNGARHTTLHKPVKLVYYEELETMEEAVKREKYFKTGSGREFIKSQIGDN
jgi:predicted GIY-YIG superfamily endonuclease